MSKLKMRLRAFQAHVPAIARYFSFACLLSLAGGYLACGLYVHQEWVQAVGCAAENNYYESRGEPRDAKYLQVMLTVARVSDPDPQWPKTICGAVGQKRAFSWVLDYNLATSLRNDPEWIEAQNIANDVLHNAWSTYVLPPGWECARWYKRTDDKGVSKVGLKDFNDHLFPVGTFGNHTAFQARRGCKVHLPTQS